ncbi:hypothetical protein VPHK567_0391 [Vibrio phage K567]
MIVYLLALVFIVLFALDMIEKWVHSNTSMLTGEEGRTPFIKAHDFRLC